MVDTAPVTFGHGSTRFGRAVFGPRPGLYGKLSQFQRLAYTEQRQQNRLTAMARGKVETFLPKQL